MNQKTLRRKIVLEGIGLQTGIRQKVVVHPERRDQGVKFEVSGYSIPAHFDYVISSIPSVTLGYGEVRVQTVEHLLSIFGGMGITNATVEVFGDEIPENTYEFAGKIYQEVRKQRSQSCYCNFPDSTYTSGNVTIQTYPSKKLEISCYFNPDFTTFENENNYSIEVDADTYFSDISWARTFCTENYLKSIKFKGYAKGVNESNCFILRNGNKSKRYELVKHKILDFIGDLFLIGMPAVGHFVIVNPSHKTTHEYFNQLFRRSLNENHSSEWCGHKSSSNETRSINREELLDRGYCEI